MKGFPRSRVAGTISWVSILFLTLSSCDFPIVAQRADKLPSMAADSMAEKQPQSANSQVLWADSFEGSDWLTRWHARDAGAWGEENLEVIADPTRRFAKVLRVHYPAQSASPAVARKHGAPLGGGQFYATLGLPPQSSLRLRYFVRFSPNFDFVKGGKLPGLFGGNATSGGKKPDGQNGFSTRFMWRTVGAGEVYAYLPSSKRYGTSIGRGKWIFQPGIWHQIEQAVVLNDPGQKNGRIQVWFDGKQVLNQRQLTFRTTDRLKIEGIFFSTFFGGDDPSWATPKEVYVDFADFSISNKIE